jgi:hypothetical protein
MGETNLPRNTAARTKPTLFNPILWTLTIGATLMAAALPAAADPGLEYSQDGVNYQPLNALSTNASAITYYDYFKRSGHPLFGLLKKTATVSVVWDSTTSALSMLFISGGGRGDHGQGRVTLTGLPTGATLDLSDDGRDFKLAAATDSLTGKLNYSNQTDGFVVGGLDAAPFSATLTLSKLSGIKTLRVTDGDPSNGGQFLTLDTHHPFYIRMVSAGAGTGGDGSTGGSSGGTSGVGTAVPEPACLGLMALGGLACLTRRGCRAPARAA